MNNIPPTYDESLMNNSIIISDVNKIIFKTLREVLDKIEDIEENGISYEHNNYIRQIMKGFDRNHLYEEFPEDYNYILNKLSQCISEYNNYGLRSIHEALEPK